MKTMKRTIICAATALVSLCSFANDSAKVILPDATILYSIQDTTELYLDIYYPAAGSRTQINGVRKPAILFMFGGGFMSGTRDENHYTPWFKEMTENGYSVISIDYRLGLKNMKNPGINKAFIESLLYSIDIAVEDLYNATAWLRESGKTYGIDADNMVICGSSAGAIAVMQAEWELCNRSGKSSILPEDFNYKGVASFSGAIFSTVGALKYKKEPCPTLMLHGTSDKIVPYGQIALFNLRFMGSNVISRTFSKQGYNYRIFRYQGNSHEIANSMIQNVPLLTSFIEENVMAGARVISDTKLTDSRLPIKDWGIGSYKKLYK